jgi:DNA-binding transcriptional LysR family regulator
MRERLSQNRSCRIWHEYCGFLATIGGIGMQSWDLVKAFLALHRAGTFDGAAQALKVDQTTIRRRIQSLETEVGVTLFMRINGQLILAPEHQRLLQHALQMEASCGQFIAQSNLSRLAGNIRVSTLDIFADLLAPDFALFRRHHPEVQLEITTEPHFVDLDRDRVDLAIRLARPLKGDDGLKKLAALSFGIYGAPAYCAAVADRGEDAAHDLLALFPHMSAMDHEFLLADERWYQRENLRGCVVARADSYPMLRRLAEEGMGLAMLPHMVAQQSSRLQRLPGAEEDFAVEIWAVIRRDAMKLRKTRLLVEWITKAFRSHAPVLAGAEAARDAAAA